MDNKQFLVVTELRIYPTQQLISFLRMLPDDEEIPLNIIKIIGKEHRVKLNDYVPKSNEIKFDDEDKINMKKIAEIVRTKIKHGQVSEKIVIKMNEPGHISAYNDKIDAGKENEKSGFQETKTRNTYSTKKILSEFNDSQEEVVSERLLKKKELPAALKEQESFKLVTRFFLTTKDIDWLYSYLHRRKVMGDDVPYLHLLLEGAHVEMPDNIILKRNPRNQLKAGTVGLRLQQEAMEYYYRKMSLKMSEDEVLLQNGPKCTLPPSKAALEKEHQD